MRVRSLARLHPRFRRSILGLGVLALCLGCGQTKGPESPEGESGDVDPTPAPAPTATETPASLDPPREPQPMVDPEAERIERDRAFARSLLAHAPTPAGQFGVVFVAGQRTADLLWTVAVENRGEETFQIPIDVSLFQLTMTPPPPSEGSAPPDASRPKTASSPQTFGVLPKVAVDDVIPLEPGEIIVGSFDPRDYCPEEWLLEGTEILASYGYAIETEVRWERGKRVEKPLTDRPPFVLESRPEETSPAHTIKLLTAAPFVLGETYPLSAIALRAPDDPANSLAAANKDTRPPESPLKLSLADLGHAGSTLHKVMQVTLTNQSSDSIDVVVKRELLSFEVTGPRGATTCLLEPTKVDPLAHNFTRLAPGQSRSLAIRLPEACPAGTFDLPGQYNVMARYRSPSSGAEFGKTGFVGEVRAAKGARFAVDPRPGQPVAKPFHKVKAETVSPRPQSTPAPIPAASTPSAPSSP